MLNIPSRMEGPEQKTIIGKPEITVSSKGIQNGTSVYLNDGADFGPDTKLGATTLGQYGPSFTTTSGILEAIDYATANKLKLKLNEQFLIGSSILLPASGIEIAGTGWVSDQNGNLVSGAQGTTMGPTSSNSSPILAFADTTVPNLQSYIHDLAIIANQSAYATNPFVNLVQNEMGGTNIILERVLFNGYTPAGNSSLNFKGNEDAYIKNCRFSELSATFAAVDGQINMGGCIFDATATSVTFEAQQVNVSKTTFRQFYFYGSTGINIINMTNCYWNGSNGSPINANGLSTPVFLNLENCVITAGESGSVQNVFGITSGTTLYVKAKNCAFYSGSASTTDQITVTGLFFDFDDNCRFLNGMPMPAKILPSASLSTNPPVSGTAYQNTNAYDIEINLPVYATTSGTAGKVAIAKGMTSTPTSIGSQYVNGATSSTSADIIRLKVPAGWYYSFTETGVTFGTASVFAD